MTKNFTIKTNSIIAYCLSSALLWLLFMSFTREKFPETISFVFYKCFSYWSFCGSIVFNYTLLSFLALIAFPKIKIVLEITKLKCINFLRCLHLIDVTVAYQFEVIKYKIVTMQYANILQCDKVTQITHKYIYH